jgi:hypothetical protein
MSTRPTTVEYVAKGEEGALNLFVDKSQYVDLQSICESCFLQGQYQNVPNKIVKPKNVAIHFAQSAGNSVAQWGDVDKIIWTFQNGRLGIYSSSTFAIGYNEDATVDMRQLAPTYENGILQTKAVTAAKNVFINIEMSGRYDLYLNSDGTVNEEMFQTPIVQETAALVAQLCEYYNIPVDEVVGHGELADYKSKDAPQAFMDRFRALVQEKYDAQASTNIITKTVSQLWEQVVTGAEKSYSNISASLFPGSNAQTFEDWSQVSQASSTNGEVTTNRALAEIVINKANVDEVTPNSSLFNDPDVNSDEAIALIDHLTSLPTATEIIFSNNLPLKQSYGITYNPYTGSPILPLQRIHINRRALGGGWDILIGTYDMQFNKVMNEVNNITTEKLNQKSQLTVQDIGDAVAEYNSRYYSMNSPWAEGVKIPLLIQKVATNILNNPLIPIGYYFGQTEGFVGNVCYHNAVLASAILAENNISSEVVSFDFTKPDGRTSIHTVTRFERPDGKFGIIDPTITSIDPETNKLQAAYTYNEADYFMTLKSLGYSDFYLREYERIFSPKEESE